MSFPRAIIAASTLVALSSGGCVKKTLSTSENFVSQDGSTVIFSLSQNELEMGRLRICKTAYGMHFGQAETDTRTTENATLRRCRELNAKIRRESQPSFDNVSVDRSDVTEPIGKVDDFSSIKDVPKEGEAAEIQGGGVAPATSASAEDIQVKLETRVVRDEVHSFFSGTHLTPRCWYRFDRNPAKPNEGPDFLGSEGRARTLLNAKRLTRYSISSADVVKSILADEKLRNLKFNIRSEEVLQAAQYNANLTSIQGNQFYTWLVGFAGAGALKLTADQLASIGSALRGGTTEGFYEAGRILTTAIALSRNEKPNPETSRALLTRILGQKKAFISGINDEIEQFVSDNSFLKGWKEGVSLPEDAVASNPQKIEHLNFLRRTLKNETKNIETWQRRLEDFDEQLLRSDQKTARSAGDDVSRVVASSGDDVLRNLQRSGAFDTVSHWTGKWLSRGYRMCNGMIGLGVCLAIVGTGIKKGTEFAIDKYTLLGFKAPTAADMDQDDLQMAANMFSSSKFNVELTRQEIELLAATDQEYSTKPKILDFGGRHSNRRNLGFIPILGDSPKSGSVCPTPIVAAEIVGLEEPDGKKFQLLRAAMKELGMTYIDAEP
jgi:hypothetical protein